MELFSIRIQRTFQLVSTPYSRIKHKIFFKTEDVHKLLESNYYHLKREL